MSIWKTPLSLEKINARGQNTLASHLNIKFTSFTDNTLTASMPVDETTCQPLGILNGGASCALIETLASTAANFAIDQTTCFCVGLSLDASHLKAVRKGNHVIATTTPIHIGRSTHVWLVEIVNSAGKKVCAGRMTMLVRHRVEKDNKE